VVVAAALSVLGGAVFYAQDKYPLATRNGIAFSDFKGYEDWTVVSSAPTDEVLKVIVANPIMIDVDVPNVFTQGFRHRKGQQAISE
jgi:hypothetical protein